MKADIIWLGSTDSTNEEARRRLSDIDNLSVLSALEQTAGRGQRGNKWSSAHGENLTFSIVLKFPDPEQHGILAPMKACDQFILTEIASLSVIDFLSSYGISARIKWPNDIYVGNRKICGMLIENSLRGRQISSSIIGIGLNINQRNFDVNLPNPTSLAIETGKRDLDPAKCLNNLMAIFTGYIEDYLTASCNGSDMSIREKYLSYLWMLDEPAEFIDYTCLPCGHLEGPMNPASEDSLYNGRKFSGMIRGISHSGMLIVEDKEKGELKEFAFKEIGFIFLPEKYP